MDWVEFGIYVFCLGGSGFVSYEIGFRHGVSACVAHLEEQGYITLEEDEDDE